MNLEQEQIKIQKDPKTLKVLEFKDPILYKKSSLVLNSVLDEKIQELLNDMVHTMTKHDGAGLAAPQVGINMRIIVLNVDGVIYKMVNPIVTSVSSNMEFEQEGCLSMPGVTKRIRRPASLTVKYIDENGENQEKIAQGLLARAVLHEIEHLDGKFFLDNLSKIEKDAALKKYSLGKRKFESFIRSLNMQ